MIYVDDNHIKISGVVIPGLVKSLEIKDDALIDEQDVEGSTKKTKQATGYDDAKITIEIILDDSKNETHGEKLAKIQNLFKKAGQTKPIVHEIINNHCAARKVKKVIFKSLSTKEENKNNLIIASLEFWAYNPVTIKATSNKTKTPTKTTKPTTSTGSIKTSAKTTNTPATDSANPLTYVGKIKQYAY